MNTKYGVSKLINNVKDLFIFYLLFYFKKNKKVVGELHFAK